MKIISFPKLNDEIETMKRLEAERIKKREEEAAALAAEVVSLSLSLTTLSRWLLFWKNQNQQRNHPQQKRMSQNKQSKIVWI